ncbi:aminodeoxychorismate lyase [Kaistella solincola]|uniref:Aminodeoxychorismate lyase n=1 Tax=Kaistella solincola TaxID=510955 RepID=A0ABR4ZTQ6_9FLAO|nr:aminotransferase class IV [Kaistella solincola]KIA85026.1 aminodeoxychorismate lyase [Kaistella solincola]
MSQFIESIKVDDRKIFMLELHQHRVNETFSYFGHENPLNLAQVFKNLDHQEEGLYKFKVTYGLDGKFRTQMIPYAISEKANFELVENNSYDYAFKFEDRTELEHMKQRSRAAEIIIVKNNHITDTSYSNLIFKKGKDWFTPKSFLLNGVQRQHLLKTKKIKESEITLQNIHDFSHFQLINAMNNLDDQLIYPISKIKNLPQKPGAEAF